MIGFRLREDGTTCDDVDECASATACGQLCINSVGSYHCACQQGFVMEQGGKHCKVSGRLKIKVALVYDPLQANLDAMLNLQVSPTCSSQSRQTSSCSICGAGPWRCCHPWPKRPSYQ